ncbi:gamma-mobile-trio integrase GmtZ [Shewanella surugensis]|uniref:Integrase family protein n=1 Tax=Shewanella surugensis TaxID=212020 RepID=A0ABT0LED0_9GAMM|nr:VPA1269 family protein [Shewanella surugensis]MCL1125511.1 integrase family protein [Shewanella surugensis]
MKSTDYEFSWFTDKNGSGWDTWRELAATWLRQMDYGIDHKRNALNRFLDDYLVPRFIIDPVELLETDGQDYNQFLQQFELSDGYRVRQNNEVYCFIDWVIGTYYSEPDDNDNMVAMFKNPFAKGLNPVKNQETVYNALPYTYIKQLRKTLCPVDRGHFSDWHWAIDHSDAFMMNGRHLRDWFVVDESDIDKEDPDCVWREITLDSERSIRLDGVLKSYKAGDRFFVIWSPVRAMALYIKLQLPLRTFQVRMLDSGEADTWRYHQGHWPKNEINQFAEGSEKRPWQKGVFNRIITPDIGDVMTGLYINTNKTADKNKDEISRGYVIPWQHDDVLYWLEKLRNWQEKYNTISSPTSIYDLDYKHFGSTKTEVQRSEIGNICFLFRHASASIRSERALPITAGYLNTLWVALMAQLEKEVHEQGHQLSDGRKVYFIDPDNHRKTLFPLHSLRVSLITCYTIEGDIPTPVLSKLLVGHSRLIMTLHYTKVTPVMMAKKMKAAESKINAQDDESLQTFLANKSIEEIGLQAAYNDIGSLTTVLRVRNPAGWQEKSIGVCLAGGNTSSLVENTSVAGCWNGGEKLKKANRNQADLHGAVPHGIENCIRCRWFITDIKYLHALTAHFNNLSYHATEAAKLAAELEAKQEELLDEEYFCEANGERFQKHDQLHQLDRRIERQKTEADEYCKDLVACFQIIRHLLNIETERSFDDTKEKIVANGSHNEISPFFSFLDTGSECRQLIQLCDDAEIYADLRDDLKKTPVINHRSNQLNTMLIKSGYMPFMMELDDEAQLAAGNAMINAMLRATGKKDKSNAMTQLANYLDTEAYLVDMGLLDEGVKAIEAKTGISILSLSDINSDIKHKSPLKVVQNA